MFGHLVSCEQPILSLAIKLLMMNFSIHQTNRDSNGSRVHHLICMRLSAAGSASDFCCTCLCCDDVHHLLM